MRKIIYSIRTLLANIFFRLYVIFTIPLPSNPHSKTKIKSSSTSSKLPPIPPLQLKLQPQLNYKQLLQQYQDKTGKLLKPVNHRNPDTVVPEHLKCPYCGAPHQFIYYNNGKNHSQFQCKVCKHTFSYTPKSTPHFDLFCPYCGHKLNVAKITNNKKVYRCNNKKCPYKHNHKHHFRYQLPIYPSLPDLSFQKLPDAPYLVNLSKIRFSTYTFSLVISFLLLGISARETSHLLKQLYNLSISHQTIINYRNTFVALIYPLLQKYLENFNSNHIIADETYYKNAGFLNYLFLAIDKDTTTILHYNPSHERDAKHAMIMIADILNKLTSSTFELTTDKAPIYNTALIMIKKLFPHVSIIHHTVKGLKNLPGDIESTIYRRLKNLIERLNRQIKKFIRHKYGFASDFGTFADFTLFALGHNILFDYAGKPPPIHITHLQGLPSLPLKVIKLVELATQLNS